MTTALVLPAPHRARGRCRLRLRTRRTRQDRKNAYGAGKSTTMRMIVGLDRPDARQVRIGGKSYGDLRWPLREVGALLEAKAFRPGRTARAHLTALAASNAIGRPRVEEVLAITGIRSPATTAP
jgi:ABC-type multidrug transport system ATPase subunit